MKEPLPVVDLHEDIALYFMTHGGGQPYADFLEDAEGRDADIPKYRRGNVRIVFASIFPGLETFSPSETERAKKLYGRALPGILVKPSTEVVWEQAKVYHRLAEAYGLSIVERASEAESLLASGEWRLGLLLHLEGADPLAEPYDLKLLYRLGLRSIGLTWNYNNRYAASCTSRRDYGLTDMGEELVKLANELGVIVDLAHASKQTVLDAASISKKPVIVSHAAARRLVDSPRNVDDEAIEAVAKTGGVVGVTAIPTILRKEGSATIDDIAAHVRYIAETFGDRYAAIGTDFHGLAGLPAPEGFKSVDRVQQLLEKLADMGLGDAALRRIAYENALRVIEENLG